MINQKNITPLLISRYRLFLTKTLVIIVVFLNSLSYAAEIYSDEELRKIQTLVPDSPKLRQSLKSLRERAQKNNKDVNTRLLLAKAHISASQPADAIEILRTINGEVEPRAYVLMAKAYETQQSYGEQARVLELLKKKYLESEFVAIELATAYLNLSNSVKATEILRERINKTPKRKLPYFTLLEVFERTKNAYEARTLLGDMKKQFPSDPEVFNNLCKYNALAGFLEAAVEECTKATELDSKHADNHVYLGLTKKNQNELVQAEKILKKAATQFPKSELAQYQAGKLADEQKNWESAKRYYNTCVRHNSTSHRCQLGLAKSSFEVSDYKTSLLAFVQACKKGGEARDEMRNALTKLRLANKNAEADEFNKKFETCGLKSKTDF